MAAFFRARRVAFFAGFAGTFFAAFLAGALLAEALFPAAFLAGDFLPAALFAGDFLATACSAAFCAGAVAGAFLTAFASSLAGDCFRAPATVVRTAPARSSAIARPYPTFSAAFSTNVLFAICRPPGRRAPAQSRIVRETHEHLPHPGVRQAGRRDGTRIEPLRPAQQRPAREEGFLHRRAERSTTGGTGHALRFRRSEMFLSKPSCRSKTPTVPKTAPSPGLPARS